MNDKPFSTVIPFATVGPVENRNPTVKINGRINARRNETYLELMLRSPERALVPSSAQSIGIRFQSLHRGLGFAQPSQEVVQGPVEVVEGVHRGVQQFSSIDNARKDTIQSVVHQRNTSAFDWNSRLRSDCPRIILFAENRNDNTKHEIHGPVFSDFLSVRLGTRDLVGLVITNSWWRAEWYFYKTVYNFKPRFLWNIPIYTLANILCAAPR